MSSIDPSGITLFAGVVPFVATARARSFRAAARQLGVTPSAVSKAVARLEVELGVRLLHRTSRTVTLTSDGEIFFARCRDAVDQVRAAREVASQAQTAPRGILRVSMPLALGRIVVMPALPRFLARYPALRIEAVLTDRKVDLPDENIDVVLRFGPLEDTSAVARRLRPTTWITAAAPSYLARHGTPARPDDLLRHNCIRFRPPTGTLHPWVFTSRTGGAAVEIDARGSLVCDHGDALVVAAAAGLGVIHALDFMARAELDSGGLVEILTDHPSPALPLAVMAAPGRHATPRVRAFVELMVELCGDDQGTASRTPA